jgi:hypothetical protein
MTTSQGKVTQLNFLGEKYGQRFARKIAEGLEALKKSSLG